MKMLVRCVTPIQIESLTDFKRLSTYTLFTIWCFLRLFYRISKKYWLDILSISRYLMKAR